MAKQEQTDAWSVSAAAYPRDAEPNEQLRFLLRYAILAPSSHNTQPWRFRVCPGPPGAIDVFADPDRRLEVIDAAGRQLYMSVGGALFNLRLAILRFGREARVQTFPACDDPHWVARVTRGGRRAPRIEEVDLFDAIPRRHTNRQPFEPIPVSYRIADQLAQCAAEEGAWLMRLHPDQRTRAAELIAAADRAQFHDRSFRRELSSWLVSNHSSRGDGIPGYSKSYGAPLSGANTLLVRTFDVGGRVAEGERDLVNGSPMLAVLGTDADRPADWVAAGQAMQRALLTATVHGLAASFLNQPLELPDTRRQFVRLTGRGVPQLVLRFGYGPSARTTPRRRLEEVLVRSAEVPARSAAAGR